MRLTASTLVLGALVLLSAAEIAPNSGVRIGLVNDAQAIIGRPFTPLSFAGVARRTAYRGAAYRGAMWGGAAVATAAVATAAVAAAPVYAQPIYAPPVYAQPAYVAPDTGSVPLGTIVSSLPAGCTATVIGNVDYRLCAGTYYRATFQGSSLVYVATTP